MPLIGPSSGRTTSSSGAVGHAVASSTTLSLTLPSPPPPVEPHKSHTPGDGPSAAPASPSVASLKLPSYLQAFSQDLQQYAMYSQLNLIAALQYGESLGCGSMVSLMMQHGEWKLCMMRDMLKCDGCAVHDALSVMCATRPLSFAFSPAGLRRRVGPGRRVLCHRRSEQEDQSL